jgi:hypothetical protein
MNIPAIISSKFPGSECYLSGDEYEGLTWLSNTPKPTKKQLEDLWPEVQAELKAQAEAQVNARKSALAKLAALGLTEAEIAAL